MVGLVVGGCCGIQRVSFERSGERTGRAGVGVAQILGRVILGRQLKKEKRVQWGID